MSKGISTPKHKGNVNTTAEPYPKLEAKLHSNAEINVQIQNGQQGLSAYELWLLEGNEGTVEDFLNSLKAKEYVHPETHPASMITESTSRRFVSDAEKASWNNKAEISDIPTKVSQLTNDSGFLTINDLVPNISIGKTKPTDGSLIWYEEI